MPGMPEQEQIEMMRRCSAEIKELRARIASLEPKAHAYDTLATVVRNLAPGSPQSYAEDLAWRLDKRVAEIETLRKLDEAGQENNGGERHEAQ